VIPSLLTALHVGGEITGLEYLVRVVVALVALGGFALVVYCFPALVRTALSAAGRAPDNQEGARR
jgi:hypothetical protein